MNAYHEVLNSKEAVQRRGTQNQSLDYEQEDLSWHELMLERIYKSLLIMQELIRNWLMRILKANTTIDGLRS